MAKRKRSNRLGFYKEFIITICRSSDEHTFTISGVLDAMRELNSKYLPANKSTAKSYAQAVRGILVKDGRITPVDHRGNILKSPDWNMTDDELTAYAKEVYERINMKETSTRINMKETSTRPKTKSLAASNSKNLDSYSVVVSQQDIALMKGTDIISSMPRNISNVIITFDGATSANVDYN